MRQSNPENPSFIDGVFSTKLNREKLIKGAAAGGALASSLGKAVVLANVAHAAEGQEVKVKGPFPGSERHAELRESVIDAISDRELNEHNIFIHPAQDTDLVVRRGALQEDTLLQVAYRGAESSKGPKPTVHIVLVNYPYLTLGNESISRVPSGFVKQYQDALVEDQRRHISQKKSPAGLLEGLRTVDSNGDYIIYLAVGGARQPKAEYSHQRIQDLTMPNTPALTPEQIKKADPSIITQPNVISDGGYVKVNNIRNVGMVLRRVLDQNPQDRVTATELKIFTRYIDASDRYQQTGDDNGFPYVFITETGLAYM